MQFVRTAEHSRPWTREPSRPREPFWRPFGSCVNRCSGASTSYRAQSRSVFCVMSCESGSCIEHLISTGGRKGTRSHSSDLQERRNSRLSKVKKVTGSFSRMIHKPFIEHRLQVSRSDDTNPSERGRSVASKLATLKKKETKSSFRVERSPRLQRIGARGWTLLGSRPLALLVAVSSGAIPAGEASALVRSPSGMHTTEDCFACFSCRICE